MQLDSLRVSRKHAIAGAVHSAKTYSKANSVVHQRQPKSQMEVVSKSRKPFFGLFYSLGTSLFIGKALDVDVQVPSLCLTCAPHGVSPV